MLVGASCADVWMNMTICRPSHEERNRRAFEGLRMKL